MRGESVSTFVDTLTEQTEDLCHVHDHITRIIANLSIPADEFSDYEEPGRAKFELEAVVRMFLYQHARNITQSEVARRLKGAAYLYISFDLGQPLNQQIISHNWRNRFTPNERQAIKQAARHIREICTEHEVIRTDEPALEPNDIQGRHVEEDLIMDAVQRATKLGFSEFSADRAENAKYALEAYFERQGYLTMANAGITTERRRFARVSNRDEVPHGSSHNRTMKKVADPEAQLTLDEFNDDGTQMPDWKRIRAEVLPAFHAGVENILDEIAGKDRAGLKEPVNVAIDITTWPFWPSPFKQEEDVERAEEPVKLEYKDGSTREVYPKEDYPEMVSGVKENHQRAYKFATLTVVAEDTPVVLAIEPVRDKRAWEPDVETRTRGELVGRLLEQAKQHVDINKVFADREFDSYEVRHQIDQHDMFYVIGKRTQAKADRVGIQKTVEHETADVSVEHDWLTGGKEKQPVSFMYVPKDTAEDDEEYIEGDYVIFTVNAHVSPDRAIGLTEQYRDRWTIENQYKSIKKNFLPQTASKDYRIRFLYVVVGVILHNVWRLTNYLLRDEVDVDLGESPPISAGEIVELVAFCLFDPGGVGFRVLSRFAALAVRDGILVFRRFS